MPTPFCATEQRGETGAQLHQLGEDWLLVSSQHRNRTHSSGTAMQPVIFSVRLKLETPQKDQNHNPPVSAQAAACGFRLIQSINPNFRE